MYAHTLPTSDTNICLHQLNVLVTRLSTANSPMNCVLRRKKPSWNKWNKRWKGSEPLPFLLQLIATPWLPSLRQHWKERSDYSYFCRVLRGSLICGTKFNCIKKLPTGGSDGASSNKLTMINSLVNKSNQLVQTPRRMNHAVRIFGSVASNRQSSKLSCLSGR